MTKVWAMLLSIALFGCGNSSNENAANANRLASRVADWYDKDCRSAAAPTAKAVKELDQLCSCIRERILSTVHDGDKDELVNKKIAESQQVCLRQVYPN